MEEMKELVIEALLLVRREAQDDVEAAAVRFGLPRTLMEEIAQADRTTVRRIAGSGAFRFRVDSQAWRSVLESAKESPAAELALNASKAARQTA